MLKFVNDPPQTHEYIGYIEEGIVIGFELYPDDDTHIFVSILSVHDRWDASQGKTIPETAHTTRVRVSRADYIAEWKQFINTVVEMLVKESLIEKDDASLQDYLKSLP